ncbi:hypothetical protein ACGLFO_03460 [Corynebacterium hesseae]|uniref:hypothetical protein n=1 Tax=Corynebacterium hesseae TaxID=2913502 RepID=UPI00373F6B88
MRISELPVMAFTLPSGWHNEHSGVDQMASRNKRTISVAVLGAEKVVNTGL